MPETTGTDVPPGGATGLPAGTRDRIRAILSRRAIADGHGVTIVDTPETRVHHPGDLVGIVLCTVGIALTLFLAVEAPGTTSGVTEDVQGLARVLRRVLFVPVTLLEGLLTVVVPAAVVVELSLRRQGRQVLDAVAATILGLILGALALWLIATWGTEDLVTALSVPQNGTAVLVLPAYVSAVAALLTAAGPRHRRRTVRWSWTLLWIAMFIFLITGRISLPGIAVAVLLGRIGGLAVRYASGVRTERAYGAHLVQGIRRAGFAPVHLARVHESLHGDDHDPGAAATAALARFNVNRVYVMTAEGGERYDVVVLDGDRQVVGLLTRWWRSLRMRGLEGRGVVSLRQAAERAALLSYAARSAGVRTPRLRAVSDAEDSMLLVHEHLPDAVPLTDLPEEQITDELLASIWEQLGLAHAAGIAHRTLTSDIVLVGGSAEAPEVWLTGWDYGDVAASELARRIDMTQLVSMLALHVGADRAFASAVEVLPADDIAAIGPLLQPITLPAPTRARLKAHKEVLGELRAALVRQLPEADVEPQRLERFGVRTFVMIALTIVAVTVVVTTLNIDQIRSALSTAQPWWAAVAFALGLLTWVGSSMTLHAFSPVPLPRIKALLTQVAGSFVAIAAPAGVGPAALNLRLLTQRGVSASLSAATVALVQVSQFVVTVVILVTLSLVSGDEGRLLRMPSSTVLWALVIVALLIAAALSVPALRSWVAAKTLPMVRQTWPRLIEVLGQPGRLLLGLGGNVLLTMGYVLAFDASLQAFGLDLPLLEIAVIFLLGNTAGAIVPTPGGLGVVELALIGGLSQAGVPPAIATSAVVLYRTLTYWARIPLGWFAMRYLQRHGDL